MESFVDNWDLIKKTVISKKYILIGKEEYQQIRNTKEKVFRIIFINVLEAALAIQENYSLFRDFVGFDFDPVSVVMELKEEKSAFWEKINSKESSFLWGVLYGFGKENSLCYSWKSKHEFLNEVDDFMSDEFIPIPCLKNFSIPIFASFFENDPVVQKYKKERENIQKEYQGENFLDHTLKLLSRI